MIILYPTNPTNQRNLNILWTIYLLPFVLFVNLNFKFFKTLFNKDTLLLFVII